MRDYRMPDAETKKEEASKDTNKETEKEKYLNGLKRYTERGIPIYVDWERLFGPCEDGMFYMGDYVQAEGGGLKEIRFDKVYLYEREHKQDRISRKKKR